MRIPSFTFFGGLSPFNQSISAGSSGDKETPLKDLEAAQKSIVKETILSVPRTDRLISTNSERYYRELDRQNRDYLSKRDPDALLYYSLVKNTSKQDTKLDLIESTNGTKDIGLISEIKPDPRIEKIISEYKKIEPE